MTDAAWSVETDADVAGIVAGMMGGLVPPYNSPPPVFVGVAPYGQAAPFVVCATLGVEVNGQGLGRERFGAAHQQWQVTAFGGTLLEARILAEQIYVSAWPDGWDFVEHGIAARDDGTDPPVWQVPMTFVSRVMT